MPYLSYGRQLYKLSRQREISGESLKMANKVLHGKWHNRGLSESVLAAIAKDVYDIAPLQPPDSSTPRRLLGGRVLTLWQTVSTIY